MDTFDLSDITGFLMHCDHCRTLSYCKHEVGSRYICIKREACQKRYEDPVSERARELGIKLHICKRDSCDELVGYISLASFDPDKIITQSYCKYHLEGMRGYNYKKPIPHSTEQGYRKGCRDYCCLAAHAEKIKTDRNIDSSLKRIPEVHEVESILDKVKDPKYIPSSVEIYAIQMFLKRFPRFFNKPNLADVAQASGDDSLQEGPSGGQGAGSPEPPEADGT